MEQIVLQKFSISAMINSKLIGVVVYAPIDLGLVEVMAYIVSDLNLSIENFSRSIYSENKPPIIGVNTYLIGQ